MLTGSKRIQCNVKKKDPDDSSEKDRRLRGALQAIISAKAKLKRAEKAKDVTMNRIEHENKKKATKKAVPLKAMRKVIENHGVKKGKEKTIVKAVRKQMAKPKDES